jgi:hypothetical protein
LIEVTALAVAAVVVVIEVAALKALAVAAMAVIQVAAVAVNDGNHQGCSPQSPSPSQSWKGGAFASTLFQQRHQDTHCDALFAAVDKATAE